MKRDSLIASEKVAGRKTVLPVWHNVDAATVGRLSQNLAGKLAVDSSRGTEVIVDKIVGAIFSAPPDVLRKVKNAGLGLNEHIRETRLLFETSKQQTWLIFSDRRVFCVLAERNPRLELKWQMPLEQAQPIRAYSKNREAMVDIGARREWLYSIELFESAQSLEQGLSAIVSSIRGEPPGHLEEMRSGEVSAAPQTSPGAD